MQLLMILLTVLMVSNVRYAALSRARLPSVRGLIGLATLLVVLVVGILKHDAFFFPLGVASVAYGVLRSVFLGFMTEAIEAHPGDIAGLVRHTTTEPGAAGYGE